MARHIPGGQHGGGGDPYQVGQAEHAFEREGDEGIGHLVRVDPGTAGQDEHQPAVHAHGAKRDDDGRQGQVADQPAIQQAKQQPQRGGGQHHERQRQAGIARRQQGCRHAAQGQDGRHRQVDAACDDHQHLRQGQHDQQCAVGQQVAQAGDCEENRGAPAHQQRQANDR
jgi:hypothetical protein